MPERNDLEKSISDSEVVELFRERLASVKEDAFGYRGICEDVARMLRTNRPPYVYAVCGVWGAGKTTFLSYLVQELRRSDPTVWVLYFNAWRGSIHQDTLAAFVQALTGQLGGLAEERLERRSAKTIWRRAVALADAVLSDIGDTNFFASLVSTLYRAVKRRIFGDIKATLQREKRLQKEFMRLSDELASQGVSPYVFIDELDRCAPSEVVRIIEALRLVFCGPDELQRLIEGESDSLVPQRVPFRYIIAVDESFVARAFKQDYGFTLDEAHQYIRKFIHFRYHFPPKNWTDFVDRVMSVCSWRRLWNPPRTEDLAAEVLRTLDVRSPREAKRVLAYLLIWQEQDFAALRFRAKIGEAVQGSESKEHAVMLLLNGYVLVHAAIKVMYAEDFAEILAGKILPELSRIGDVEERRRLVEQRLRTGAMGSRVRQGFEGLLQGLIVVDEFVLGTGIELSRQVREITAERIAEFWGR